MWCAGGLRARYLVGAGGTHCPVARVLAPTRPRRAVGVQELELQVGAEPVARTRLGNDGEPELLLFDGVGGYGWNVPKSDWINVGCGTLDATAARAAWRTTHDHLRVSGHLPAEAAPGLEHLKGHSYFLFAPAHLDAAYRDHAFLVGDSLGLAHPITAEGILPATVSGRHAAEAILAGVPASYPDRLRRDPVLADYRRVHAAMTMVGQLRGRVPGFVTRFFAGIQPPAAAAPEAARSGEAGATDASAPAASPVAGTGTAPAPAPAAPDDAAPPQDGSSLARTVGTATVARGFAWMFSGARLPAPRLLDLVLGSGE
jgi:flavin-dependent dehydrogenase